MADTIEAFVEKLQDDGVKAGQQAAEQIKSEAQQEAKKDGTGIAQPEARLSPST